jgi:16S rRNA (uracil1498-N3)-methyltransferase
VEEPTIVIDGEQAHQMRKVLHLQIGETVVLSDGHGKEVEVEILEYGRESVKLKMKKKKEIEYGGRKVILYAAILKHNNFEWAVQKATEVGVSAIVPIITKHTVKTGIKGERLQKIIRESCEQSQRSVMPELREIMNFDEAIKQAEGTKIIFDFGGKDISQIKLGDMVSILVGPEGGWTSKEIEKARAEGFIVTSLGNNILRGETAAAVGSWGVIHLTDLKK